VILVEMPKEVAAEANRGQHFRPPPSEDELAFYETVSTMQAGAIQMVIEQLEAMVP
jgi:type I restriction enzyme R subunit